MWALSLWLAIGVRAQPVDVRELASQDFDRGIELVSEGAYAEAAAEFGRAYELTRVNAILYNLGMALAAAQRPVEAESALAHYLQAGGESLPQDERARIEVELQRQRARIGVVDLMVSPAGARIAIDGRDVGVSPLREPVRLGVGEHRVAISLAEHEAVEKLLKIAGGQHERVEIALRRSQLASAAPATKLPIRCAVPDVEVLIDEVPAVREGTLAPALTSAGAHVVRFRRAGYAERAFRVNLPAGVAPPMDCALRMLSNPPARVSARLELQLTGVQGTPLLNGEPLPANGIVPYGRHRLEFSGPDFEPVVRELSLAPGETRRLKLRFSTDGSPQHRDSNRASAQRLYAYVLGAGGIGLGVAALAVYLAADGKHDRWSREDDELVGASARDEDELLKLQQRQSDNDALLKSVWRMDTTATVLAISGAVLLGAGGIVFLIASSSDREAPRRVQLSFHGVGLRLRSVL